MSPPLTYLKPASHCTLQLMQLTKAYAAETSCVIESMLRPVLKRLFQLFLHVAMSLYNINLYPPAVRCSYSEAWTSIDTLCMALSFSTTNSLQISCHLCLPHTHTSCLPVEVAMLNFSHKLSRSTLAVLPEVTIWQGVSEPRE